MSKKTHLNTGSTLIEVLVAILIVGLVVTGAMLSIAYSVKNSAEARYREAASQLAQDGMEIVKLRREIDPWSTFSGRTGTYCLSSLTSAAWPGSTVSNPSVNCPAITKERKDYTRYVIVSTSGTRVEATVHVEWDTDGNVPQDVEIKQVFQERVL